jgi:hypothetical protein
VNGSQAHLFASPAHAELSTDASKHSLSDLDDEIKAFLSAGPEDEPYQVTGCSKREKHREKFKNDGQPQLL